MPEVTYKSSRLHYDFSLQGEEVIVLLHGFCEDIHLWDFVTPLLSQHFRILSIDFPGFGKSEVLGGVASVEAYAESVLAVLQREKVSGCYMIGHSLGGYVALALLEKYPEMLKGLSLFHSQPFADDEARKESRLKAKQFVLNVSSSRYVEELINNLFSTEFKQNSLDVVNDLINRYNRIKPEGIVYALDAMRIRKDRVNVLKKFNRRVLFLIGRKDSIIPYSRSLEFSHLASVGEVVLLDNSAHMGMIEEPEKTVKSIIEWIN
jgi:pimeloyl-ACP methyl ester carboxylesterase